ncbi:chloride channel protein, partial [bacterium]|nr:chloride channel protein [bacterium]
LEHTYELLVYVALGLACGAVAVALTRGIALASAAFERVPLPEWAKPAVGGLAVGLMAIELTPRVLGNGYETVDALIGNRSLETALVLLVAAKLVATCVTLGSGGSGGVFGPSLFVGAVLGSLVGRLAALVVPVAPQGAYALVGMAAFVAGATHAPVSMVLMLFEMSDNYRIVLPLLIATSISSVVARKLYRESIDTVLDARAGKRVHRNVEEMALNGVSIGEAARPTPEHVVSHRATLKEVLAKLLAARTDVLAVVDDEGRFKGVLSAEWLREGKTEGELAGGGILAADMAATDVPVLDPTEPLTKAIDAFHGAGIDALPVVAREGSRFLGFLREGDIVTAYRHAVLRSELVSTLTVGGRQARESRLDFPAGVVTCEIRTPGWLVGKTLAGTNLRTRYGVSVLALQSPGAGSRLPEPGVPLASGEQLVVIGPARAVEAMKNGSEPELLAAPAPLPR